MKICVDRMELAEHASSEEEAEEVSHVPSHHEHDEEEDDDPRLQKYKVRSFFICLTQTWS